jgi:hypothetical protein
MWLVARYSTDGSNPDEGVQAQAQEWWDNNAGGNYRAEFRCVVVGKGRERENPRGSLVSAPRESFFLKEKKQHIFFAFF